MVITFAFARLHAEGAVKDDLDAYYHVVADEFRLMVDMEIVFCEAEFPVIELADALDLWMLDGTGRGDLAFTPTGYDAPAFQILSANGDWAIVSSQRTNRRWYVKSLPLETSIQQYREDVHEACRHLDVDLNNLLLRIHKHAGSHGQ